MEVKDFIFVADNLVKIEIISALLRIYSQREFEDGKIADRGGIVNKHIRDVKNINLNNLSQNLCDVHWANLLNRIFIQGIEEYKKNKKTNYLFKSFVKEIAILKYGINQKYNYHIDYGVTSPRNLSCILLLNNDYEGGNLCFKDTDDTNEMVVENRPGRLIIWPSNFMYPHCVKPVTKGTRYSVVAWAV